MGTWSTLHADAHNVRTVGSPQPPECWLGFPAWTPSDRANPITGSPTVWETSSGGERAQPTPEQARETIAKAERLVALGRELERATADALAHVVEEHARVVAPLDPVTTQVDLSTPTAEQQPLLEALDLWRALDAAGRPFGGLLERVLPVLEEDLPATDVLTSGLRWAFAGGERRRAALAAWERVSQVVGWADKRDVAPRVRQAIDTPRPRPTRRPGTGRWSGRWVSERTTPASRAIPQRWMSRLLRKRGLPCGCATQSVRGPGGLRHRRLLIADEPGLGASVQALGLLANMGEGHHMVIASRGQQTAWAREISRRTRLPVFQLLDPEASDMWHALGGVAIATHDDAPDPCPRLGVLVIDDAHYLRERTGRRASVAAELSERSDHVLLLMSDPGFRVSGPTLRRLAADVPYELPHQTRVVTWLDPTSADRAAHATAVLAGNFSQARRAGFATGDPSDSAKLARVVETVNAARKNGLRCVVTSHFLGVLTTCSSALSELGFRVLGPVTESTPVRERDAALAEFAEAEEQAVLVTQLFDDGLRLDERAAGRVDVTVITEPPTAPVEVPGRLVYVLALVGTVDDGIVAAPEGGWSEVALGRILITAHKAGQNP